jgi:uncharacterized protein involved in exopolysaccharide biosynthesis
MNYPDGIPPQRTANWIERPAEAHHGRRLPPPLLVVVTLTIVLLGIAAGVAVALRMPKSYGARAEILYSTSNSDQGGDPLKQDRQLSTQLVLLKSQAVLGPVAKKQGRSFEDVSKDVSASVLENSNVIDVEAHGVTEPATMQTLQAVVDSYLALASKPSALTRNLTTQLTQARENTAALQARERQLTSAVLAGTATQASLNEVRTQLTTALDWENAIRARMDEVAVSGQAGSAAQVLTPPYALPAGIISTSRLIAVGLGTLAGLIVAGVVFAVGASRAQRRAPRVPSQSRRTDVGRAPVQ